MAGGIGFENLGEPGPEDGQMAEAALALGGIDGCKEFTGQDVFEKDGIAAEGTAGDKGGCLADRRLQPTPRGGKNGEREVG